MNRHRSRARRGYTLVFFAMFLFGFMALAALVIDIGFARLTQRQMQTAVDAAALEGLRFRDEVPQDLVDAIVAAGGNGGDPSDPEYRDYARRWLASRIVALTFDDNLDPDDGDEIGFGAGPVVELTGGVGDPMLNAGQLLRLPDTPFYKPLRSDKTFGLELNLADDMHGDMVAGEYDPEKEHWELPSYSREDFTPTPAGDAFLVRMRRTDRPVAGLDQVDNVSSHGPSIPYLFARGAFLPASDPNTGYSPRHHGMTVRATGIADARPVLSVGLPNRSVNPPLTGLVASFPVEQVESKFFSFVLKFEYWKGLPNGETEATVTSTGEILDEDYSDDPVGRFFYELEPIPKSRKVLMPLVIGRSLPNPADPPLGTRFYGFETGLGDLRPGYVPIYSEISDGATVTDRIVGFGEVTAEVEPGEGDDKRVRITRWAPRIVPENASATVSYPLRPEGNELTSNELSSILEISLDKENFDQWILVPVSVR